MNRVSMITVIAIGFILGLFSLSLLNADEQLTITTYYPSPFGYYNQLQANRLLYTPQAAAPVACNAINKGMTFFGTPTPTDPEGFYYCNGTEWLQLEAGSSTDLYLGTLTKVGNSTVLGAKDSYSNWTWTVIPSWSAVGPYTTTSGVGNNILRTDISSFGYSLYQITWGGTIQFDARSCANKYVRLGLQTRIVYLDNTVSGWVFIDKSDVYEDTIAEEASNCPTVAVPKDGVYTTIVVEPSVVSISTGLRRFRDYRVMAIINSFAAGADAVIVAGFSIEVYKLQ